ncbi:peptidoglycan DD-metalloendopeptidase family protein [Paenibacillus thailandensis]|uniref:Peptidoglycan DD-metalloendopeptidase family protein n=1 Tax=Paenibacillus thailandensis TaxID=393250 RepID=A0ABW5R0P0_9BACL
MTDFRDKDQRKQVWAKWTGRMAKLLPAQLKGKAEQEAGAASAPFWRKKPAMLAGGALVVLASVTVGAIQYVHANTVDYYHVYRNGTEIGTVASPADVDKLLKEKAEAARKDNPDLTMVLDTGTITYFSDSGYKEAPATEQTLAKLDGLIEAKAAGVQLIVDGKPMGTVKDQETADAILERIQAKYAPELAAKQNKAAAVTTLAYTAGESKEKEESGTAKPKNGTTLNSVSFVEDVSLEPVQTDPGDMMDAEDVYKKLVVGSVKPTAYTVQPGDCVGCIAEKFDISSDVIYKNNPWIKNDMIKEGDQLDLTVRQPELTVKTVEEVTETVAVEPAVEIQKNSAMRVGESKVIREGVKGSKTITYRVVKQNGTVVSEQVIDQEVTKEAVSKIVVKGTKVVLGEGTGTFAWPVSDATISSSYGSRWGRTHKGIDITGDKSIMAADDGVVEFVGTKSGYGNTIVINHKNGYETLYGHLKSFNVEEGDIVEKGDVIAVMGSTGRSTGVHLHFEIHENGTIKNPLNYL